MTATLDIPDPEAHHRPSYEQVIAEFAERVGRPCWPVRWVPSSSVARDGNRGRSWEARRR